MWGVGLGAGFGVWVLGFWGLGLGFSVCCFGFGGVECGVWGVGCGVWSFGGGDLEVVREQGEVAVPQRHVRVIPPARVHVSPGSFRTRETPGDCRDPARLPKHQRQRRCHPEILKQRFSAYPFYGRARCCPMLGAFTT